MKYLSLLILTLLSASLVFAQSEDMRSKIGTMLRQDAKTYAKTEAKKGPEKKPAKKPEPVTVKAAPEKAMTLPKYRVQARPFAKESQATIDAKEKGKAYDKEIAREKAASKQTSEDKLLNNKKTSIMGPLTSEARSQDALVRAHELEVKSEVVGTIVDPKKDKENKELLDELNDLEVAKHYQ